MKTVRVLVILLVAIAAAAAIWTFTPSHTPPGQQPLAFIQASELESLREEFNRASAGTRIIVLLSPT